MGKSCKDIAQSLVDCMKKTECVKNGGGIKMCMKDGYAEGDCKVKVCNGLQ